MYRAREYGLSAEPRPNEADTSLSINEVELMVDGTDNRIVFVAGYCPYHEWRAASLVVPSFTRGALVVETDQELVPGISTRLNPRDARWTVLVDVKNGWLCIEPADVRPEAGEEAVEFAPGCVAVLKNRQLAALWLHPKELPDVVKTRLPS